MSTIDKELATKEFVFMMKDMTEDNFHSALEWLEKLANKLGLDLGVSWDKYEKEWNKQYED